MQIWGSASRKWKITLISIAVAIVLPFIYEWAGVGDNIAQIVLAAVIALPASYNVSNAIAKKHEPKE
jgi:hypothetical protein